MIPAAFPACQRTVTYCLSIHNFIHCMHPKLQISALQQTFYGSPPACPIYL